MNGLGIGRTDLDDQEGHRDLEYSVGECFEACVGVAVAHQSCENVVVRHEGGERGSKCSTNARIRGDALPPRTYRVSLPSGAALFLLMHELS